MINVRLKLFNVSFQLYKVNLLVSKKQRANEIRDVHKYGFQFDDINILIFPRNRILHHQEPYASASEWISSHEI